MAECFLNGLKTVCEKEKLLVMSNFSFSHTVFKRLVLQTHENQGLLGKGLIIHVSSIDRGTISLLYAYLFLFSFLESILLLQSNVTASENLELNLGLDGYKYHAIPHSHGQYHIFLDGFCRAHLR